MVNVSIDAVVKDVLTLLKSPRSVWLFGSRRHGDALPGSDIDMIVDAPGAVEALKTATLEQQHGQKHGGFLDLFVLDGKRAVSLSHDCYLECEGPADALLEELGAVLVWDRQTGLVSAHKDLCFSIDTSARPSLTHGDGPPRVAARGGLLRT